MSKTFTRILVAVDFSEHAAEALLYAASVADRFFSSLIVLHTITKEVEWQTMRQHLGPGSIPLLGPFSDTLDIPMEQRQSVAVDLRERAITALRAFLPPDFSRRNPELLVRIGHPFEQILEAAAEKHIDLIVMGTHGHSGLKHTLLGSVAERVVRLAPCPVLTVKAPPSAMS